ncbi:MAG: hypothetical protein IMY72_06625 [Bacteroidetes bacterium]|nr:hypothetical protein [Bacteroidota bacterium]
MKKLTKILVIVVLAVGFFGCATTKIDSVYKTGSEILKVGNEGTKLIKVWGYGKTPDIAITDAKRNAVDVAIFKGFSAGGDSDKIFPIVSEDNSRIENKVFFDDFFKVGGKYLQYVNSKNYGVPSGKDRLKLKYGYNVAVSVSIEFDTLRKYLEEKGIARRLDEGF